MRPEDQFFPGEENLRVKIELLRGELAAKTAECRLKAHALERAWGDITDLQVQLAAVLAPESPGISQ